MVNRKTKIISVKNETEIFGSIFGSVFSRTSSNRTVRMNTPIIDNVTQQMSRLVHVQNSWFLLVSHPYNDVHIGSIDEIMLHNPLQTGYPGPIQ